MPRCCILNNTTSPSLGVSLSQTQQQSQTPSAHREDLYLHRKRKRQNRKSPYLFLSSLLRRSRRSEEDQAAILASTDSDGPNYRTLH